MLLRIASWRDVEEMPGFERDYHYKEAVEVFTDKKTGKITV